MTVRRRAAIGGVVDGRGIARAPLVLIVFHDGGIFGSTFPTIINNEEKTRRETAFTVSAGRARILPSATTKAPVTTTPSQAIKKTFLSSPAFAVVGASKDPSKWGTKVLQWYKARDYKVTPVHPVEPELEGLPAVKALADLPNPAETSVSVITPAPVTLKLLEQAKALNVPALWLQPGTFDNDVSTFIESSGLKDRVIYGGHQCILVEGDGIRSNL